MPECLRGWRAVLHEFLSPISNQRTDDYGASVTFAGHSRPTYRNFFRPEQRWMFSGLRLARDTSALGDKSGADLISRLPTNIKG
jgi:hypothetical protein